MKPLIVRKAGEKVRHFTRTILTGDILKVQYLHARHSRAWHLVVYDVHVRDGHVRHVLIT